MDTSKDQAILKRYTRLSVALDMLVKRRLTLMSPATWEDKNDIAFMEAFQQHEDIGSVLAACFTQTSETFHHWQVFGRSSEGVCVEVYREPLLSSLKKNKQIFWKEVEYLTRDKLEAIEHLDAYDLPFYKQFAYRHENEFRIVYVDRNQGMAVKHVPIELPWIKRIIINPWLPEALQDSLSSTIKAIPDCGDVELARTTVLDSPRWKRAISRLDEYSSILGPPPKVI